MGSAGEATMKAIDPSVGGLVWVRRRNGSWWPGRIMGLDELNEGCLVSPRSGTPVKLLGREDASVDWYNLEKSKRVKAFRCGEYDDCIAKAKASANSNKKAVKYARREDAILHALEIENVRRSKENEYLPEEAITLEDHSNSALELSQSGLSFEDPNHIRAQKSKSVNGRRRKTPNDSEDDGNEGTKRMRGLEDLGMGVDSNSVMKRKRSQVAYVHEFLKRKDRRRPLTKVLESTAMVSVPVICDQLGSPGGSSLQGVSDCKFSGLDSNDSKRSLSMVINNNSDSTTGVSCENGAPISATELAWDASDVRYKMREREISSISVGPENESSDKLFDVPFVGESKRGGALSPKLGQPMAAKSQDDTMEKQSRQSSPIEAECLRSEGYNESACATSAPPHINTISDRLEKGPSEWQLKGKRNSRHLSKKIDQNSRTKNMESNTSIVVFENPDGFSSVLDQKLDFMPKSTVEDRVDHHFLPYKQPSSDFSGIHQRLLPFRQSRFTVHPKYHNQDWLVRDSRSDSTLYDVCIEVKASYRPQHVPLVSLMSKLNGKAIVGHPLTTEVLEDGFCDDLMSRTECYPTSSGGGDLSEEDVKFQPIFTLKKSPNKSKKSGFSLKKTRKLSSLTSGKESERRPVVEKLNGGPVIACVPLKVVFSRINEAVNGSSRPVHRRPTLSNP